MDIYELTKPILLTMTFLLRIFLLLLVVSCGEHSSNPEIYGAWQTVMAPKDAHGINDNIVFLKPDSLKIYYVQKGVVIEHRFGKFYINKNKSQLITEFDTSKFRFDIIELTNSSLQMRRIGKHAILNYRRLTN